MLLLPGRPADVVRWAWDETPSLRRRQTGSGLAIVMTGQFLSTYFGRTPVAVAADTITWALVAWLVVSFLWFVINLFRAPRGLYRDQQERAQKEFDDQTRLNCQ
jgi:predicted MFS family arabinose efflux permease